MRVLRWLLLVLCALIGGFLAARMNLFSGFSWAAVLILVVTEIVIVISIVRYARRR